MSVLRSNCCRLTNWHYRVIFPFQSVKSSQNLFNTHKQNNTIYFKVADFATFTEKSVNGKLHLLCSPNPTAFSPLGGPLCPHKKKKKIFCAVLISAKIDFECYGVKI